MTEHRVLPRQGARLRDAGGRDDRARRRRRKTAVFQFDVPASSLPPGLYTCQINVVDDAAGSFVFPRLQILVRR